jgi:hypothetical protein
VRRLERIRGMVEERERTATELAADLHPTVTTGAQRHFAMAEILAYLAHHEVRGILRRDRRRDGVYVWRAQGSRGSVGRQGEPPPATGATRGETGRAR